MKKILIIVALVAGLIACENQKIEFPDYTYTSGYFPYQYPVRTIILGDDMFPNDNDNNHIFLISAAMGGVYSNTMDRTFNIQPAPTLCNKVKFSATGDTIRLMPQSYYTLSSSSQIIIPSGSVNGSVQVHLEDAFFNDPKAIKNWYVIPLQITSVVNLDTLLQGKSTKTSPDPRVSGDWAIVPKNFTMFAVKFINPYSGNYLHRGVAVVKNASSTILETTKYHSVWAEQNEIWKLVTTGKNTVSATGSLRSTLITGALNMTLTFADNGTCTITQTTGSAFTITGSGSFVKNSDSWGGSLHNAIYMTYQLTSGANTYFATDTMAVRDRAVVMEVYTPVVLP